MKRNEILNNTSSRKKNVLMVSEKLNLCKLSDCAIIIIIVPDYRPLYAREQLSWNYLMVLINCTTVLTMLFFFAFHALHILQPQSSFDSALELNISSEFFLFLNFCTRRNRFFVLVACTQKIKRAAHELFESQFRSQGLEHCWPFKCCTRRRL